MNYINIYNKIIQRSQNLERSKKDNTYYEKHHIFPKCLGGNDNKDNLVLLTAREHFICHKLLIEIYPESTELKFAFWAMCNQKENRDYTVSSRDYAVAKATFAEINSKLHKGKKLSEEHIKIITDRMNSDQNPMKGRIGELNSLYGIARTESVKSQISKTKKDNPKKNANYKGYYVTPKGNFYSSTEAAKLYGVNNTTIIDRCKKNQRKITNAAVLRSKSTLSEIDIDKTYKEAGWDFIEEFRL